MIDYLYQRKLWQLILVIIFILCLINFIILFYGFKGFTHLEALKNDVYFPDGYIIGMVWTFLMTMQVYIFKKTTNTALRKLLFFLIVGCIAYPVYTQGFSNPTLVILGNLVTMVYSSFIAGLFFQARNKFFYGILLTPIWITFVTFLMFRVYS